jgi:hypothetical protein
MYINGTKIRADCDKYIGLHSCWNKSKSGLGGVEVTYLNFGLGARGVHLHNFGLCTPVAQAILPGRDSPYFSPPVLAC